MVVKATVFILCLVLVPLMMEARLPEDPSAYSARENNVANGQSPQEDTKEAKRSFVDLLRDSPGENCICQCCPTDWLRHGQFCYYAEKNSRWPKMSNARTRCQELGGDLPVIKSADQNEFIFSLARNQTGVSKWGVWLGLTRNADDSKFYWIDGSPLEGGYDNWKMDEPNDLEGHEDCVNLYVRQEDLKRFWNDIDCNFFMPDAAILCQRSINP